MTQDERWSIKYQEVMEFIELYHRNPSRHRIEEHLMLNWVKANRRLYQAGQLKEERIEAFKKLMAIMEKFRRKNQYE